MNESLVCPICDTPNESGAVNCEVCGERLAPLGEGEVLNPEENVSGMLQEQAAAQVTGFSVDDSEANEDEYAEQDDGLEDDDGLGHSSSANYDDDEDLGDDASDAELQVLYSPVDGTAYPAGTPEFEDGFGPMGEELVAEKPDLGDVEALETAHEAGYDDSEIDEEGAGFAHDDYEARAPSEAEAEPEPEPEPEPVAARPAISALRTTPRSEEALTPLPTPGTHSQPATLTVFQNRLPVETHDIDGDELLIGRRDPVANAFPDIDLSGFDPDGQVSRKHAYIYRQHKNYTLYVISNTGTQLNSELLGLGDRRTLNDGDVIVLAGKLAMKFQLPEAQA
ncbi:MAG: FHA domain-containing protein [Bradymonadaceae bacterium]|nr:FHA domain-containing protein [Lujinxingiaceae bacterium]